VVFTAEKSHFFIASFLVFCSFFAPIALVFPVAAVPGAAAVPAARHAFISLVWRLVFWVRGV